MPTEVHVIQTEELKQQRILLKPTPKPQLFNGALKESKKNFSIGYWMQEILPNKAQNFDIFPDPRSCFR